jgi:hypothetical protein
MRLQRRFSDIGIAMKATIQVRQRTVSDAVLCCISLSNQGDFIKEKG